MVTMNRFALALFVLASLGGVASACNPEATKDASVPCKNDVECTTGLACLPTRNGLSGECLAPVCSKKCKTDDDCKNIRFSSDGKDCFSCRDVGGCSLANGQSGTADAGTMACVDRCELLK